MAPDTYKDKTSGDAVDRSQMRKIQSRKLALLWLRQAGWKCSRANFYKHVKAGKLPMSSAGTIDAEDLRIYASAYLQPTTPPPDHRVVSAIFEQERTARIALLEARKKKLDLEHGLLAGRYVERDQVLLEFCAKLGLIDSLFKNSIRTSVAGWLLEIGADPEQGPALFSHFEAEIDKLMDSMASMETIKVRVRRTPEVPAP